MKKLIENIKEIKIKTHQYAKNIINNNTMADEYLEWFNRLPNEYWTYASGVFLIFEQFIIKKITQEQAKFLYDDITQQFINEREMCLD